MTTVRLSALAGLLGAAASVLAKLASSTAPEPSNIVYSTLCRLIASDDLSSCQDNDAYTMIASIVRVSCIGLMVLCNAQMWGYFTRALAGSDSTRVTMLNTAANLCFTALLGWMFFGEELRLRWWIGAGLVVAGTVLMQDENNIDASEQDDSRTERKKDR